LAWGERRYYIPTLGYPLLLSLWLSREKNIIAQFFVILFESSFKLQEVQTLVNKEEEALLPKPWSFYQNANSVYKEEMYSTGIHQMNDVGVYSNKSLLLYH